MYTRLRCVTVRCHQAILTYSIWLSWIPLDPCLVTVLNNHCCVLVWHPRGRLPPSPPRHQPQCRPHRLEGRELWYTQGKVSKPHLHTCWPTSHLQVKTWHHTSIQKWSKTFVKVYQPSESLCLLPVFSWKNRQSLNHWSQNVTFSPVSSQFRSKVVLESRYILLTSSQIYEMGGKNGRKCRTMVDSVPT